MPRIQESVTEQGSPESLVEHFPHVLAVALREYLHERSPYARLHRLTSAVEVWTRFAALVALNEICQRSEWPAKIQRILVQMLERPTFGAWKDVLQAAGQALGADCVLSPLKSLIEEELLP